MEHVFVMTYGRSGSTLLMGILNSIPGWLLRGENRHAMRHLYEFHRSGLAERARVDPARASQPTHPWFGIEAFPEDVSLQHIRALAEATLLRPEPDTRVTGYKEIRWYDDDLPDYLDVPPAGLPGCPLRPQHPQPRGRRGQQLLDPQGRPARAGAAQRGEDARRRRGPG